MPTSENILPKVAADRVAIERWEGEGGKALALADASIARSSALPSPNTSEESSISSGQTRSPRETPG